MQEKIPIVVVITSLDAGGTEGHLLRLLPRLDTSLFDICLYPLRPGGTLTHSFADRGVPVVAAEGGRLRQLVRIAAEARRTAPIVHCFLPEAYLLGASVVLMLGAGKVIMSRRSRNHYQHRHPVMAWVERRLHRRMDALLGNSRAVVDDLIDEGAPSSRVRLIYNGIDGGRFPSGEARAIRRKATRAALGLSETLVVLTCVANLFAYKGHVDLVSALSSLGSQFTGNGVLLMVGRDAGARAALAVQVDRLGLSGCVRFLGERNDVEDLLIASDVGILASHEEGFSNAVLEGMAAGLPMIVTRVGGNPEAIIDGESGYVVPPHDSRSLADAIAKLIMNARQRAVMGEAAHRRVVEAFSLDACVSAYEALYKEVWDRRWQPRGD